MVIVCFGSFALGRQSFRKRVKNAEFHKMVVIFVIKTFSPTQIAPIHRVTNKDFVDPLKLETADN